MSLRACSLAVPLVFIAACSETEIVEDWRLVSGREGRGTFVDFSEVDLDTWIVSSATPLTVQHHRVEEGWDWLPSPEIGGAPTGIWASGPEDVWVAGPGLWRWDGGDWREVVIAPLEDESGELLDVWGTAPDDVWVLAHVGGGSATTALHFDGASWVEDTELSNLLGREHQAREGCSNAVGDVWVRGVSADGSDSVLFHRDATTWDRTDADQLVVDIACDGETVWLLGNDPDRGPFLHFRAGSQWEPRFALDQGWIQFEHLCLTNGRGWITGRRLGRVEFWGYGSGDIHAYLEGKTFPGYPAPNAPDSSLRAIVSVTEWGTYAVDDFAFGPGDLVYVYGWDNE